MKVKIKVSGMDCGSCAASIDATLKKVKGVNAVKASFAAASVEVDYDPKAVSITDLKGKISSLGYSPL